MKEKESMCPLLTAAMIVTSGPIKVDCIPSRCMWAMRKTAIGEDGKYHTVGYRCAVATGSDRYVEVDE